MHTYINLRANRTLKPPFTERGLTVGWHGWIGSVGWLGDVMPLLQFTTHFNEFFYLLAAAGIKRETHLWLL